MTLRLAPTPRPADREAGPEALRLAVLLLHADGAVPPILDHLESTLVAGVDVRAVPLASAAASDLSACDVLWLEDTLPADGAAERRVLRATERGALVVSREARLVGTELAAAPLATAAYPGVRDELRGLQAVVRELAALAVETDAAKGWLGTPDAPHVGTPSARPVAAPRLEVVVAGTRGAHVAVRQHGAGEVLWLGLLPPAAGSGFRVESHRPARAAATQLLVDEVLAYAFARRYGFAVRKLLGAYGCPMMAWQAHVEEAGGLVNGSMLRFTERVARERQVPTFSLIRRAIEWGHRVPGLVHFPSAAAERYVAQPDGPAFFSGRWLLLEDGAQLGYASDPRYVEHYVFLDGQPRLYPEPLPDGRLAVGTPDGTIDLFAPVQSGRGLCLRRAGEVRLASGARLRVEGGAAPTLGDLGGAGRLDLVVADGTGSVHVFLDRGAGYVLAESHRLEEPVSPRFVDWHGTGRLDLLVGTASGRVDLYEDFARDRLARRSTLFNAGTRHVAPFPIGPPGERTILFGDLTGHLQTWSSGRLAPLLFLPWLQSLYANIPEAGSFWLEAPDRVALWWVLGRFAGSDELLTVYEIVLAIPVAGDKVPATGAAGTHRE